MFWKQPPIIKIYEALGAVADGRVVVHGNNAQVMSSDGTKTYTVTFDPDKNAIMANDNGSYWQGYLGYPAIAFLMEKGIVRFSPQHAAALKGIPWKKINVQFKDDYTVTARYADEQAMAQGIALAEFHAGMQQILDQLATLRFQYLGSRMKPPASNA